jgi:hypothetical protein
MNPTKNQAAVLAIVAAETSAGRTPVTMEAIRRATSVDRRRYLTHTVAYCIRHRWLEVNERGFAAYNLTDAGRAVTP